MTLNTFLKDFYFQKEKIYLQNTKENSSCLLSTKFVRTADISALWNFSNKSLSLFKITIILHFAINIYSIFEIRWEKILKTENIMSKVLLC